jgi:hypothetical protein
METEMGKKYSPPLKSHKKWNHKKIPKNKKYKVVIKSARLIPVLSISHINFVNQMCFTQKHKIGI